MTKAEYRKCLKQLHMEWRENMLTDEEYVEHIILLKTLLRKTQKLTSAIHEEKQRKIKTQRNPKTAIRRFFKL